jgi:hypothetical protein
VLQQVGEAVRSVHREILATLARFADQPADVAFRRLLHAPIGTRPVPLPRGTEFVNLDEAPVRVCY